MGEISTEFDFFTTLQPSFSNASSIRFVSLAKSGLVIIEFLSPRAAKTNARFVADLEPGISSVEFIAPLIVGACQLCIDLTLIEF
jgi:hypothetical protein